TGAFSNSGAVKLTGGTLAGATVQATTALQVSDNSGTLQDVTLAGTLTLGGVSGAQINVAGAGLTLQGGTISLSGSSSLAFSGNQALGGTGTVTISSGSAGGGAHLTDSGAGNTLTIAKGVTVHGGWATIDTGAGVLHNLGTISADASGAGVTVQGTNWVNDGIIQASGGGGVTLAGSWTSGSGGQLLAAGGTVNLTGTWSNAGTISLTGAGTLGLGGALTLASIGTLHRSPATT